MTHVETTLRGACSADCEYCRKRPGVKNSVFIFDDPDDTVGIWICLSCEGELWAEGYDCPCGCGGDDEHCVYEKR